MTKIEQIKEAINRANNLQSKMDETAWSVPALSSLRIRHLMNNLGAISTRYFECGVHKGGLFCSTIRNNRNLVAAVANDNFASDNIEGHEQAKPQFLDNVRMCCPNLMDFGLFHNDTFETSPERLYKRYGPIDLYLFDGDHSYDSQRKAVTHFLAAMTDEFILCVDDFDWDDVSKGTRNGLADANVEILFEEIWKGNDHDNDGAWNGFGIFLLKKK